LGNFLKGTHYELQDNGGNNNLHDGEDFLHAVQHLSSTLTAPHQTPNPTGTMGS
jgi:hypothetical protein